ncbi:MAG: fumarylacetoacetate hydrolase family protein [Mycobacterium sp.]
MHEPRWAIVQYRSIGSTVVQVGLLVGDKVYEFPFDFAGSLLDLLGRWDEMAPRLRAFSIDDLTRTVPDCELLAPLTYPAKVICAGANYSDHVAEMKVPQPDPATPPFFFLKPPSTTVIGPGVPVPYPPGDGVQLDWEVELGVVIAHRVRDLEPDDVPAHVAGYVVANDISARGRLLRPADRDTPFAWDWLAAKGMNGSCPIGPGLVPSWLVADPQNLGIRLAVNGVLKQNSSTAKMIAPINRIVSTASWLVTLEPGDLVLTGTPAGVGAPRGEFLGPGDIVVAQIDEIGELRNPVATS